jgi:hypothetical protein
LGKLPLTFACGPYDRMAAFMPYLVGQRFIETAVPIDELFAPIVSWSE